MTIYRDEQHAAIRACAVDSLGQPVPAKWQSDYRSGFVEELTKRPDDTEALSSDDRIMQDCMTRALMHRTVTRGAFYAMVAKYSADEQERADAIHRLSGLVTVDAPDRFKTLVIWTWASVAVKRGVVTKIAEMGDQARRTLFRKRKAILEQLQAFEDAALTDMAVVLGERELIRKAG